jgi:hypothetical protein
MTKIIILMALAFALAAGSVTTASHGVEGCCRARIGPSIDVSVRSLARERSPQHLKPAASQFSPGKAFQSLGKGMSSFIFSSHIRGCLNGLAPCASGSSYGWGRCLSSAWRQSAPMLPVGVGGWGPRLRHPRGHIA